MIHLFLNTFRPSNNNKTRMRCKRIHRPPLNIYTLFVSGVMVRARIKSSHNHALLITPKNRGPNQCVNRRFTLSRSIEGDAKRAEPESMSEFGDLPPGGWPTRSRGQVYSLSITQA